MDPASRLEPPASRRDEPTILPRLVALLEVLICSDVPTQIALATTFGAFGIGPSAPHGHLSVGYVVALSLLDTAVLLALVLMFVLAHGESPREIFFGRRPLAPELVAGLPLVPVALGIAMGVLLAVQIFAPRLHTVEHNPLQELLRSPRDAWLFAIVVIVAGGVREEIQRAFLLRRFEVWLGGGVTGVIVTSVAFGAGHLLQGADAAIATGLLGAFWGSIYLRRRSCAAPMVSHAGFDLLQIVQFLIVGR